jgi:hypothetical protein
MRYFIVAMSALVVLSEAKDLTPARRNVIAAGTRSFAALRMTKGAEVQ